ncbi:MAG: hypothetical protein ACW98Y_15930 [Candidatus Thorarchaeota archaeon]|jgi:hypothetical protein
MKDQDVVDLYMLVAVRGRLPQVHCHQVRAKILEGIQIGLSNPFIAEVDCCRLSIKLLWYLATLLGFAPNRNVGHQTFIRDWVDNLHL